MRLTGAAAPPVVFLDRDGTINHKAPEGEYITRWQDFRFLPGAVDGIVALTQSSFRLVVASNQRGVALGRMRAENVEDIHRRMVDAVRDRGGTIEAVYWCPHDIGACDCRKPAPGMLLRAARERPGLRLDEAAIIGDATADMQAGAAVGATTILLTEGTAPPGGPRVDRVVPSLREAAAWLIAQRRSDAAVS